LIDYLLISIFLLEVGFNKKLKLQYHCKTTNHQETECCTKYILMRWIHNPHGGYEFYPQEEKIIVSDDDRDIEHVKQKIYKYYKRYYDVEKDILREYREKKEGCHFEDLGEQHRFHMQLYKERGLDENKVRSNYFHYNSAIYAIFYDQPETMNWLDDHMHFWKSPYIPPHYTHEKDKHMTIPYDKQLDTIQLNKYFSKDIKNILIYTNLEILAKNIDKRRRTSNPRDYDDVFEQFGAYYIKTSNKKDSIDKINLDSFIKSLEQHLKHQFESKKDLVKFATGFFKSMNITGKEAYIKPRYSKFHMVVDTTGKTPKQLKDIIFNNF
jgi:hypothetical protein